MEFMVKGYLVAPLFNYFNLLVSNLPFNYLIVFLLNILQGKLFKCSRHGFVILPDSPYKCHALLPPIVASKWILNSVLTSVPML